MIKMQGQRYCTGQRTGDAKAEAITVENVIRLRVGKADAVVGVASGQKGFRDRLIDHSGWCN